MKIPVVLSEEERQQVAERYTVEKHSMARLARDFGVCVSTIQGILEKRGITLRTRSEARRLFTPSNGKGYNPTPAEIKKACEEIQKGWSERKRLSRIVVPNPDAAVQIIHELGIERGGFPVGH